MPLQENPVWNMQASARAGRLEEELVSLKRKEQGAHDRAEAAERQLADAQAELEAAKHAAQHAQREAAERAEALQAEAVVAREQAEDLRDRAEALESQLLEKASAASRTCGLLSYQILRNCIMLSLPRRMVHRADSLLFVSLTHRALQPSPTPEVLPFCGPATKHTWQAC
jgi:hypothetical protein